jgi:YHS domain-containing protein
MVKDPVCGMMVDEKIAKYVSEVEGVRTYFFSVSLKLSFSNSQLLLLFL